jgi:hypothetical protein
MARASSPDETMESEMKMGKVLAAASSAFGVLLAVFLQAGPAAAQPASSCTEPATSGMPGNACKLKAGIGFASTYKFPPWKAVDVGIYHDANTVRDAFRRTPVVLYIDDWADQILSRISFLQTDTKLNLVLVTVSDLGFGADGASLKGIYEHASQRGLPLCPAELGPALRLSYLDQPLGEYPQIAMRPIARSDGKATNFVVAKGLRGWMLIGNDARDETVLAGDVGLVFVQPD